MKVLDDAKYDIVALSSMGIRINPVNRQPVHISSFYEMQATSAETNTLNVCSSLGKKTKVLTKFVDGSPISLFIKGDLRRRNIEYEGKSIEQSGPWGYRHQFNISDSGYGVNAPRVWNDRAGEVGQTISVDDFDLKKLFFDDKCKILHLSGLIVSLSPSTADCCRELVTLAKKAGTVVSFDLNYRSSFWKHKGNELSEIFCEIARNSDILIGNEEDFQLALGIKESISQVGDELINYQEILKKASEKFNKTSVLGITIRNVLDANVHQWGAIVCDKKDCFKLKPKNISVLDRIGGGDSFTGGFLYGILNNWTLDKSLKFGWASGAMAMTVLNDYIIPLSEEQIWDVYRNDMRVKR